EHRLQHLDHEVARRIVVVEQDDFMQARTLNPRFRPWRDFGGELLMPVLCRRLSRCVEYCARWSRRFQGGSRMARAAGIALAEGAPCGQLSKPGVRLTG